jgi:hypothetical protein
MASSAIPLTPRRSPTALVTKSTIYGSNIRLRISTLRRDTDHSREDVRQGASKLEHNDNDSDGNAHDATARATPLLVIDQEALATTYLRAAAAPRKA